MAKAAVQVIVCHRCHDLRACDHRQHHGLGRRHRAFRPGTDGQNQLGRRGRG
jgi:hypothetical protein